MRSDRLLVWLKPHYLGDAVMATPLLDALGAEFDRPDVTVAPLVHELLQDRSQALRFVPAASSRRMREFMRHVRDVRAANYDAVMLVNRSFRSALIARLAGIRIRVGHACECRGMLLTARVPYDQKRSEAESFLDLARAMGVPILSKAIHLSVTDAERRDADYFGAGEWIGVQPGARSPWKQIPQCTLVAVARELRDAGFKIALFGGSDERADAAAFAAELGGESLNLVGQCKLRQTMGALTHLKLLIGSDTGLMHVGAAVGCPTLTVFGVVPSSKWGHLYAPHVAVQAPDDDLSKVLPDSLVEIARGIVAGRPAPVDLRKQV